MLAVVPNFVHDEINEKLDAFFAQGGNGNRSEMYSQMLSIYDQTCEVPDIVRK